MRGIIKAGGLLFLAIGCSAPEPQSLRILYTGGLGGYLEPCGCREGRVGGVSRMAKAFTDSAAESKTGTLRLDAGDFAESYVPDSDPKNRYLLQALSLMGYDAINVTALDLMAGETLLRWAKDSLSLPLISSNLCYKDNEQRIFPEWKILNIGYYKIGVIGAGSVRPLEMRRSRADLNLKYTDPEAAIRQAISKIKPQCNLIILLCDFNARMSREFAAKLEGIDLIISSMELTPNQRVRKYGYAYVSGPSRKGKAVTALRLQEVKPDSLVWYCSQALLDTTRKEDARITQLIEKYHEAHPAQAALQSPVE